MAGDVAGASAHSSKYFQEFGDKHMRLRFLLAGSVFALALATAGSSRVGLRNELYRFNYENVLGTSAEIKVLASSEAAAERAEQAALREIDRLNGILSGYTPLSEFSRWTRTQGEAVPVSPELSEVLALFGTWRTQTGGALDASAEAASRIWKSAAAQNRVPTSAELSSAVKGIRGDHWKLDSSNGTATHLDRTPLVLNSLAKSYVIGKAANVAANSHGVSGVVVNIGGDLVARGNMVEQVDIIDPKSGAEGSSLTILAVRDRAVATSGNYRRGFDIQGKHYSHIIDPRTALPTSEIISSTVVAPDAAQAGALATAFSVMKPAESRLLAANMPGVEYLLVRSTGERLASKGWNALAAKSIVKTAAPMLAAAGPATFDASMELAIQLELTRLEGRGKRPYLAAWIVDQDKFPVRTVALWFEKPRWLNELRAWYKDDRLRAMAEGSDITKSVSSATRAAGKYALKWDGKDNTGKLVKAGKYTVMIECVREHGTYQLLHQEIDFSGTPKQFTLPGGSEIASASLDYRKAAK